MLAKGQVQLLRLLDDSDTSDSEDEDLLLPQLSGERVHIPKDGGQLWLTLTCYKTDHPTLFRSLLRISPRTFDALFSKIEHHLVFQNNSDNQQIPVDHQLAVCTRWVMKAVCDENFRKVVMRWPNDNQKEDARNRVESRSCPGWHDGWLMVDGTLVPFWYDHKSNYSFNVQLISTPSLRIIDYGVGLPGSQHDATAWKQTWIPLEHETLLGRDEWVWADTAYPLQTWCQAPYKKPEKDIPENARYNYYVSRVHVRSEHLIWVTACIVLHNFAMLQEAEEDDGGDVELNEFFREGLGLIEKEQRMREARNLWADEHIANDDRVHEVAQDGQLI
ncbi:hypothetical protein K439DRAFT_1647047 [Ramaria rubella]|nr:hypothetical protein K439DRAFT_1647047 [Ramaria rubella]